MNKILFSIAASLFLGGTAMAQCTTLSGTLSADRTLFDSVCYHMEGCFVVPDGKTLTIEAGTKILCASGSNLVVERGGVLTAIGTTTDPIVFTSDQTAGNRHRGDWGGIALFGKAPNNEGLNATREVCVDRSFGGTVDNDNSGTLQFVRIEYAGSTTDREEPAGLTLASVGSGTTIDDVQVSESAGDGILALGGTYNAKYLLIYNAMQNDLRYSLGYQGKQQFLLGLRMDITAHAGSPYFSNGIYIQNNDAGTVTSRMTLPLLSNISLIGPDHCGSDMSSDFHNGITFDHNGAGTIRNSAISKWADNGLFIQDSLSIGNTATAPVNLLNFSSNAIINATGGLDFDHGDPWTNGCNNSMADWINGPIVFGCEESNNDFTLTDFGYNANLCDDYCDSRPTLTRSGTDLNGTDFSTPFNTFFSNVNYKGAIDGTDWTISWAEFCPQEAEYCNCDAPFLKSSQVNSVHFVPNPSNGTTIAYFETDVTGTAKLSVLDNVTGAVLRSKGVRIENTGKQQVSFSVKGLRAGVYPVRIEMNDLVLTGQIVVR